LLFSKRYGIIIKNASEDIIVELALSIVSLVVGVVSIALAIVSMVSTTRTEKRTEKARSSRCCKCSRKRGDSRRNNCCNYGGFDGILSKK
jgi:hypothetical protein